jgi:hypothetical protein
MVLHYDKPLQLWLSCQGSPGAVAKLLLDAGIGAVAKALQTLGDKPRLGAKSAEFNPDRERPQAPAQKQEPRPRIHYVPARKRTC